MVKVTVWVAFEVFDDREPHHEDIIVVTSNHNRMFEVLRSRAEQRNLCVSTSNNPLFSHEFRRVDNNATHSYIAIKEYPVL